MKENNNNKKKYKIESWEIKFHTDKTKIFKIKMEQFNKRKEVSIRSYHKQKTLNLQTSFSMEYKIQFFLLWSKLLNNCWWYYIFQNIRPIQELQGWNKFKNLKGKFELFLINCIRTWYISFILPKCLFHINAALKPNLVHSVEYTYIISKATCYTSSTVVAFFHL